MKKFLVLAALALVALTATQAQAAHVKVVESLGWLSPNVSLPGGGSAVSYVPKPLNDDDAVDTTGVFSLQQASWRVPGAKNGGYNVADSIYVGYVVAFADSGSDAANTLTACVATIDASGDGQDWATVGTVTASLTSDDPVAIFPLIFKGADHQNLLLAANQLRIRFTTVTGTLTAVRLKLIYWKDTEYETSEQNVGWSAPNVLIPGGAWLTTPTKPLASEAIDTTGVFSLLNADLDQIGSNASGSWADSLVAGFLVVYTDSTADGASTLTAATASIDASGDGTDWVTVGTVAGVAASDDPIVVFPLGGRLMGSIGNTDRAGSVLFGAPMLRVRFATATGYLLSARVKLIYKKVVS